MTFPNLSSQKKNFIVWTCSCCFHIVVYKHDGLLFMAESSKTELKENEYQKDIHQEETGQHEWQSPATVCVNKRLFAGTNEVTISVLNWLVQSVLVVWSNC